MVRRGTEMTIKEVSEQLGITQDTLRYYEKVGMNNSVLQGQKEELEIIKRRFRMG